MSIHRRRPARWLAPALLATLLWSGVGLSPASASATPLPSGRVVASAGTSISGTQVLGTVAKNSIFTTTGRLNFRTGPATSHKVIRVLAKGVTVVATGKKSGTWYQVSNSGKTGWVSSTYLRAGKKKAAIAAAPAKKPSSATTKFKVTGNLNLRTGPATTHKVIKVIPKGTIVAATGKKTGAWYQVTTAGTTGWASGTYLKATTAKAPAPAKTPAKPATKPPKGSVDCRKVACVALTFDDGPGKYTNRLLDDLKKKKVKATFFLVGNRVSSYPAVVRRIDAEGHQLGNHSWDHKSFTKMSLTQAKNSVKKTNTAVKKVVGYSPQVLRPPYGSHTKTIDTALKMPIVTWSVDTLDWQHRNPSRTISNVLRDVKPGSIVLMHDIHATTVDAVPKLITELKARGYTMVTVSELFAPSPLVPGQTYRARIK